MPGKRLVEEQRLRIEVLWSTGADVREIAVAIGRDPSTVRRELNRHNSARHGPKNPLGQRAG